jgi:hypothetical protein
MVGLLLLPQLRPREKSVGKDQAAPLAEREL